MAKEIGYTNEVFVQVTLNVAEQGRYPSSDIYNFNKVWYEVALPLWEKHGGKHIGSYHWFLGGPSNQIIRLFEFKDMATFSAWNDWVHASDEGHKMSLKLNEIPWASERRLLKTCPTVRL